MASSPLNWRRQSMHLPRAKAATALREAQSMTIPYTGVRAPHGRRRVAVLTNQLLDWEDRRPRYGGGERYAVTLANLMRELGLEVTFFQPHAPGLSGRILRIPRCDLSYPGRICRIPLRRLQPLHEHHAGLRSRVINMPEYGSGHVREDALMMCHGIWFDHNNYPGASYRTPRWYAELQRLLRQPGRVVSVDTNSVNYIRAVWPDLAQKMRFIPNFFDGKAFFPQAEFAIRPG